jgi:hypothetical protein
LSDGFDLNRGVLDGANVDPRETAQFPPRRPAASLVVLRFFAGRRIRRVEQLNAVKGKKRLEESLWKLLELNGKYGGDHISEGVRQVERSNRSWAAL